MQKFLAMICGRGRCVCPIIGLSVTALTCGVFLLVRWVVLLADHSHSPCLRLSRWFFPLTTLSRRACPSPCSSLTYSPCLSLALLLPYTPLRRAAGFAVLGGGQTGHVTGVVGGGGVCMYGVGTPLHAGEDTPRHVDVHTTSGIPCMKCDQKSAF